jgi:phage shock protein A
MALINRMSRLFTADVHAVLDRIEEPDVLLKQAIREMEEELARSEQRVRALEHEREALAQRHRKVQAALLEIGEQLDVCFNNGNDELARKVIKRRLETERLERHVAERRATVDRELTRQSATTTERREQLDVMRQKADLLAASPTDGDDFAKPDFAVGDADVEVAFLRERDERRPS